MKKWRSIIIVVLLIGFACMCVGTLSMKEKEADEPVTQLFERYDGLGNGYCATKRGDSYAMYDVEELFKGSFEIDCDGLIHFVDETGVEQWFFSKQEEGFEELWNGRYRWYDEDGSYKELERNPLSETCVFRWATPVTSLTYMQKEDAQVILVETMGCELWFRDGVLSEIKRPLEGADAGRISILKSANDHEYLAVKADEGVFVMELGSQEELRHVSVTRGIDAYSTGHVVEEYRNNNAVFCVLEDGRAEMSTAQRWNMEMELLCDGVWGNWMGLVVLDGERADLYFTSNAVNWDGNFGDYGRVVPSVGENVYKDDEVQLTLGEDGVYRGYVSGMELPQFVQVKSGSIMAWRGIAVQAAGGAEPPALIYTPNQELGVRQGDETLMRFFDDGVRMIYTTNGREIELMNRTNYAQY